MLRFGLMKYTAFGTIGKNVRWREIRGPIPDRSTSDIDIESGGYEVHEKVLAGHAAYGNADLIPWNMQSGSATTRPTEYRR